MFLLLIVLVLISFYFYATRNHDYWSKRNVKHDPPLPLFGNHIRNQLTIKSITQISVELYNKYPKERVIGYYRGRIPELVIRDLDIAKQIMSVDFAYFYPRDTTRNADREPLFTNLFHTYGDRWRLLRQRLTPAFTTAKLKAMFPLVVNCADRLQKTTGSGGTIDTRELMARFTTEFIGACGFGIDMNTINNERSQFRELGKVIFNRSLRNRILLPLIELFPELKKILYIDNSTIQDGITAIVKQVREQRNHQPIGRNDFIDLLLELEKKGKITGESIEKRNPDGSPVTVEMEMDLTCMVAQVFIFFAAGFETSSSATSYTLHSLALNPDVQHKVQEEIDRVLEKYNNQLCYDAVAEMSLLDMTFKEAMRMFPSLGVLTRVCAKKYVIPDLGITIEPGVRVLIPVQAIHMDKQYHDNPTEFRPERFLPEEVHKRHKYSYLPFGQGPRACIGEKLGLMQSLAGLAALLHKFSVEPAPGTRRDFKINPASNVVQGVLEGLPVNFKPRK